MKVEAQCTLCANSTRKGLLWLGGGDWLECPDCNGTGIEKGYAELYHPKERTVSIAGVGTYVERRHHPSIRHLAE